MTAHTARYGELKFTGTFGDVAELLRLLGIHRVACGASCTAEVTTAWQGTFDVTTPQAAIANKAAAEPTREQPPFCIAVLGTPPLASQPKQVRQLIDHIIRANTSCSLVVFGEPPDAWIADTRISKTGIYRYENIPAILRHHRASVAYFPSTRDPSFHATRRDVLSMGMPLLSHDRGGLSSSLPASADWSVLPATGAAAIYAALEGLHEARFADLR